MFAYGHYTLQHHFLYWQYEYALCAILLQLADDVPKSFALQHCVDRAPLLVGQWHDGRALDAWQNGHDVVYFIYGRVHHHIFLVVGFHHCV